MKTRRPSLACLSGLFFVFLCLHLTSPAAAVQAMYDSSGAGDLSPSEGTRGPDIVSFSTSPMSPNGDAGWFRGAAPMVTFAPVAPVGSDDSMFILYDWGVNPPATIYAGSFAAPSGQNTLYFQPLEQISSAGTAQSRFFKVDTGVVAPVLVTPPEVQSAPMPVEGTIDLAASAADAVSGIRSVSFFYFGRFAGTWDAVGTLIGSSQAFPVSADIYRESWNTMLVPDGDYKLQVQVRDVAGNTAFSAAAFVRVNNYAVTASTERSSR
ncbi:MAG: hypothetical protein ACYC33_08450 [Thermoleophilia bacterium]